MGALDLCWEQMGLRLSRSRGRPWRHGPKEDSMYAVVNRRRMNEARAEEARERATAVASG